MIPLGPEALFSIFGIKITDAVTATLLTDAVLLGFVFAVYRGVKLRPGTLQNMVEMFIEYMYSMTEQVAGKRAASIFPWFASFFIFIFFANILGLFPGYGLIEVHEGQAHVPLFRVPSSDFNTTFALACISLVATHAMSIKFLGVKRYLMHFFSLSPLLLFIGFLELVSEVTKLISFSFRLFGNIFAGEVVLGRVSSIASYIAPIPFLTLEIIVAIVQALVFSMLTMVFMSILTEPHTEHGTH